MGYICKLWTTEIRGEMIIKLNCNNDDSMVLIKQNTYYF